MNVKKKIRTELDNLVYTVATTYNNFITEDIPDKEFEQAATTVQEATDAAEENLVYVANEVVTETIKFTEEQAEKKADRLTKMLPETIKAPEPVEAVQPLEAPEALAAAPPTLEGPVTPLPTRSF